MALVKEKASSEYLSSTGNADLSTGDKDFSLPLLICGVTEMKKEKRCARCKFILPLTDFYTNNTQEDKHARICKICERDSKREAREMKQHGHDW